MIDPKRTIPADTAGDLEKSLSEEERARRLKASRAGLSINDTIARDANLSVGGHGVDTSGVAAGAGAGAGMASVTPGRSGVSPAPNIVPGASGSGTTARSNSALTQNPAPQADASDEPTGFTASEIAARAYHCWHERGCPEGSPEVDWERARRELMEERRNSRAAAASR